MLLPCIFTSLRSPLGTISACERILWGDELACEHNEGGDVDEVQTLIRWSPGRDVVRDIREAEDMNAGEIQEPTRREKLIERPEDHGFLDLSKSERTPQVLEDHGSLGKGAGLQKPGTTKRKASDTHLYPVTELRPRRCWIAIVTHRPARSRYPLFEMARREGTLLLPIQHSQESAAAKKKKNKSQRVSSDVERKRMWMWRRMTAKTRRTHHPGRASRTART